MQVASGRASASAIASVVESLPPLCNSHGDDIPAQERSIASHSLR